MNIKAIHITKRTNKRKNNGTTILKTIIMTKRRTKAEKTLITQKITVLLRIAMHNKKPSVSTHRKKKIMKKIAEAVGALHRGWREFVSRSSSNNRRGDRNRKFRMAATTEGEGEEILKIGSTTTIIIMIAITIDILNTINTNIH